MRHIDKMLDDWAIASDYLELLISNERLYNESVEDSRIWGRMWVCQAVVEFCALKHFQIDSVTTDLNQKISEAIRLGIEFYYGDWKETHNMMVWCDKQGWAEGSFERASALSRNKLLRDPKFLTPWQDTLSSLKFLCTVSNHLDERATICDWFGSNPKPEYSGLYWESEATTIVLASYLRSKPMEGIEGLIGKILKCKRPYALSRLRLIQSCFEVNQEGFSDALTASIDLFYKSFKAKEPRNASGLIALDESTVVEIALSKGLVLPELTEKQRWAVMTKDSIGLDAT